MLVGFQVRARGRWRLLRATRAFAGCSRHARGRGVWTVQGLLVIVDRSELR